LRKALESGDLQSIKDKTEALKQVSYKIAEEIYKQQGASGQQGGDQGTGPDMSGGGASPDGSSMGGDNTKGAEDADYEVVNDK
jgi:molecular chaperone DnaK